MFQPVHRGGGRAGKIAQVLHRHAAHAAQQLQHLPLHGGGFGPFFGVGHGLLRRNGKGGDPFGFVMGLSQVVRLRGHPLFPGQVGQHLRKSVLIGNQIPQSVLLRLPAQILQQFQHCPGIFLAEGLSLPAPVLRQGNRQLGAKPQSRREHHPDGVKKGAEIPLPQKSRQPKLAFGEHGFLVQTAFDGFQLVRAALLHRQDDSLRAFVGPSEGQHDPLPRPDGKVLGNIVGIGLVYGKIRRRNSNFRDHSSRFSSCIRP